MTLTRKFQTKEKSQTVRVGDKRSSKMLKPTQALRKPQLEKKQAAESDAAALRRLIRQNH